MASEPQSLAVAETTWYRARFDGISPVVVISETAAFLVVKDSRHNRREKKITDWVSYHPTWDAAKAWLVAKATGEREMAVRRLDLCEAKLAAVKAIDP